MKNLPALLRQIIVFCGVGVINTVFSLAIIIGLSECLDIHYLLANIIGYGEGLLLGFTLHKYVTFRSRTGAIGARREFFKFLVVFATGYMAQFCVLMLLVEKLHVANILAQISAWVLYVAVSFAGNKFFTFKARHK